MPKFPKKKEKEVIPVEAKKRRTLATSFIPGSKKLLEEANKKNEEKKNNITINVSLNVNKPEKNEKYLSYLQRFVDGIMEDNLLKNSSLIYSEIIYNLLIL